jgi:tetratricopeptide (TPR) repeat protein
MAKLKKLLFVGGIAGLSLGSVSCSSDKENQDDSQGTKTEVQVSDADKVVQDNVALFEASRSDIKFALAFVENYYPYIYWCGEAWTTGHGLTVLYNADGTYKKVTKNTSVPSITESDVFKGRYLTHEVLPDIKNCIKVPMDEPTLIAACVLRYCIGHNNFKKSQFVKQLNAGKTGAELAKTLTGWRKQEGVPNRCYFFAAIMAGKMQFSDLLDLRAEGCYNLTWKDIFVYGKNGEPKVDKNGFCEWNFEKLPANLRKAKNPRVVPLNLGDKKQVRVNCCPTKEIVPDYIWQEVCEHCAGNKNTLLVIDFNNTNANEQNDISYIAYQNGDYKKALEAGKAALELAETNKQKGAANYNIGITYIEMGKYNKAIKHLQASDAFNPTNAAKEALKTAQDKQASRNKTGRRVGFVLGAGALAAAAYGRKKYIAYQQRQVRSR